MDKHKQKSCFKLKPELILSIALSIFLITKMIRAFSKSTAAGGIWNYIQIGFIVFGIVTIFIRFAKLYRDSVFTPFLLYTVLAFIHGLIFLEFSKFDVYNYMMIVYPVCILALIYRDAYNRDIENNRIIYYTYYCISAIFIVSMFRFGVYSTETGAVADVYYILGLLPLVLILTKGNKMIPCAVCGAAVLISGKRMGIILCVVMIVLYYFINAFQTKNLAKFFSNFFKLLLVLVVFFGIMFYINSNYNINLTNRFEKMLYENDSSGRNNIWNTLIYVLKYDTPILYLITGRGDGAVTNLVGNNAHNDFLEILYNFGIFPCIFYITFYIQCVVEAVRMLKNKYEYAAHFLMSVICSIGLAYVSFYVVAPTYITCGMMCIGYILIDFKKKQALVTQKKDM